MAVLLKVFEALVALLAVAVIVVLPTCVAVWGSDFGYTVGVKVGLAHTPHEVSITHSRLGEAWLTEQTATLNVHPNVGLSIAFGTLALPFLGLTFYVLRQMRRLLDPIRLGEPFTLQSLHRLRRMAIALAVCEPIVAVLQFALSSYCANHFMASGIRIRTITTFDFTWVLVAIFIYAFAEIFRHGVTLERERRLTV